MGLDGRRIGFHNEIIALSLGLWSLHFFLFKKNRVVCKNSFYNPTTSKTHKMKEKLPKLLQLGTIPPALYYFGEFRKSLSHVGEYEGWRMWANGIACSLQFIMFAAVVGVIIWQIKKDMLNPIPVTNKSPQDSSE